MNKFKYTLIFIVLLLSCKEHIKNHVFVDKLPLIYPDYIGVTIPVNIAPLNFTVKDNFDFLDVDIYGSKGNHIYCHSKGAIEIPIKQWRELLKANQNDSISVQIYLKNTGEWIKYKPFVIYINSSPIDYGIVYRLIAPGYETYSKMGIYERDLFNFKQRSLFENTQITNSCVNCHTFNKGNPDQQSIHIRGQHGATIIQTNGDMKVLKSTTDSTLASCMYPYWHPSGQYMAYSTNVVRQSFHSTSTNLIDSFDENSDVLIYDIENNELLICSLVAGKSFETFPSFSADGKKLYFCSAEPKDMPSELKQVRYNLCSIAFNQEDGTFGNVVDTLIHAASEGKSVSLPRESYDGRFIMYALTDYSSFSSYHKEADLWLLDLQTGEKRVLDEVNSDCADSYHNWSTNSRWFIFGSRRENGLYTRAFIAYMGDDGKAGKPFILPQKDPWEYYQDLFLSYNCLEFVTGRVPFNARDVEKKLMAPKRIQMDFKKL